MGSKGGQFCGVLNFRMAKIHQWIKTTIHVFWWSLRITQGHLTWLNQSRTLVMLLQWILVLCYCWDLSFASCWSLWTGFDWETKTLLVRNVPGNEIEEYINKTDLGHLEMYEQYINGKDFLVSCQKDSDYVTKIRKRQGVLVQEDHTIYCFINREWKRFKYVEPMLQHNKSKHLADDIDNCQHNSIWLQDVWVTKWWQTQQFTFFCIVAKVNIVNSQVHVTKGNTDPQLTFFRNLANDMLGNEIIVTQHNHHLIWRQDINRKNPRNYGKLDHSKSTWKKTKTDHVWLLCSLCCKKTRLYCSCNPAVPIWIDCCGNHVNNRSCWFCASLLW